MTREEFRAARLALGLTLEELGRLLGYGATARQRAWQVESGYRRLPPQAKRLIVAYLAGYRPHDWPLPAPELGLPKPARGLPEPVSPITKPQDGPLKPQ